MTIEVVLAIAIVAVTSVLIVVLLNRKGETNSVTTAGGVEPELLLRPVREQIESLSKRIQDLDKNTATTKAEIQNKIDAAIKETRDVYELSLELGKTTTKITTALQGEGQRGDWGELQLRRVVEMAGLSNHVTYREQVTTTNEDNEKLTPDLVVQLADGRAIVVDSKAPDLNLDGASPRSAEALKGHIDTLARKNYQKWTPNAMDLVVCFVPSEGTLASALSENLPPSQLGGYENLMEYAFKKKVLLATPMSLLGLLKAIEYGWKQLEQIDNSAKINEQAKILCDRAIVLLGHFVAMGKSLSGAMKSYNDAVGSANSRLIPQIKTLRELGVDAEIKPLLDAGVDLRETSELPENNPEPRNLRDLPSLESE